MESTSYVLSFRMVFFLPCDHGLLCEKSINQSIKWLSVDLNRHDQAYLYLSSSKWKPSKIAGCEDRRGCVQWNRYYCISTQVVELLYTVVLLAVILAVHPHPMDLIRILSCSSVVHYCCN